MTVRMIKTVTGLAGVHLVKFRDNMD